MTVQKSTQPISHVFVLMLENHSFDNIFAMSGIPGITAATTRDKNSYEGTDYYVSKGAPVSMPSDPGHEFPDVVEQLAGQGATYPTGGPYPEINNSGFVSNYATSTTEGHAPPREDIGDIMKCFDTPNQLPVIYQLATEFALCDHWFSSLPGPTWPNRFFVHGASSAGLATSPSDKDITNWEFNPFSGFKYPNGSIFDAIKAKGLKYCLYNDANDEFSDHPVGGIISKASGSIPQVTSIKGIHHREVKNFSHFASDLQKPDTYDYQYTFIEPHYGDIANSTYKGGSSQHPMDDMYGGEGLIKATYEAIRNSPLWESSLLIITYDEHGGFYDSVKPGAAPQPGDGNSSISKKNDKEYEFTFSQYGLRVPAVVISPLIKKGVVDHTTYDHASVLATLEQLFGIAPLTERDKQANDVRHLLSLKAPRTDCPTKLNNPVKLVSTPRTSLSVQEQAELDQQPIPKSGYLASFLVTALKTELDLSDGSSEEKAAMVEAFQKIKTKGEARVYLEKVLKQVDAARADEE